MVRRGALRINLYVVTHKSVYIPAHPLLVPLQIGTAYHEKINNMLHDDTGDNISYKNNRYCELTGQYWVWKNQQADYYGRQILAQIQRIAHQGCR